MSYLSREQSRRIDRIYFERFYVLVVGGRRAGDSYACDVRLAGSTGNVYTIALRDRTLACDCPDSVKMGRRTCCKHLAFLLIKVGRLPDTSYFSTRRLTPEEERALKSRLEVLSREPADATCAEFVRRLREAERSSEEPEERFRATPSSEPDDCPVCFESLGDISTLVMCPTCRKRVHAECMRRWLAASGRTTCVYCRSDAWAAFVRRGPSPAYVNVFV